MNNRWIFLTALIAIVGMGCEKNEVRNESYYSCNLQFIDSSFAHPKAALYQNIIDENRKKGLVGVSVMIKDKEGVWLGASGKADLASGIDVAPCNQFLIASISKVFTAAAVFKAIDQDLLGIDDPVTKWVDEKVAKKLKNVDEATIAQLLNHTSGIPDYYTLQYELDRINKVDNDWSMQKVLAYAYGKKATHNTGETYYYSNSNYLLLGMILERVYQKKLETVYQEQIFDPLQLASAYFSESKPLPDGLVKGYVDIYGNGQVAESEFLYKDELNTADGGIAINAYDLGLFIESLMKGALLSEESLNYMKDWFDLPAGWEDDDFGHFQNGYGLEHNKTPYGNSVGHTGGIDGFLSILQYFPEHDATFILFVNYASYDNNARKNIYEQCLHEMFDEQ